jgi:hypothetical protein
MTTVTCDICGWQDKQPLKWPSISGSQRLAIHKWSMHGEKFPFQTKTPAPEKQEDRG